MNTKSKLIGFTCLAAAAAATAVVVLPTFAGRGANRAEVAGTIRNGGVDAIISTLEKAENMPATSETIALVEGLLAHDDYRAREAAAWWFARRPFHKDRLTTAARTNLASGESLDVRNAADTLGTFRHPRVVSALASAASRSDIDGPAKAAVIRALGTIAHSAANPALAAAMSDSDAAVKIAALKAWAGVLRQSGAQPAVALLTDADADVRRLAARVVGGLREAGARAGLETILAQDGDELARRNAAFSLGRIGESQSRAVLTDARDTDESALVRAYATSALRSVGL